MTGRRLVVSLIGLAVVAGLVLLRAADPYPVQAAREATFDFLQRLKPREAAEFPVRVADIDEASMATLGQWPWPRSVFAQLTERLTALGAAAVVYDVLFPEPDRTSAGESDNDAAFASALAAAPSVLGFNRAPGTGVLPGAPKAGFAISGEDPRAAVPQIEGAALPLPVLASAAAGMGAISLHSVDSIGVVRRLPMLWAAGEQLHPALSIEALRVALGVETIVVFGETGGAGHVEGVRVGDFNVPTTGTGDLWLYYRPPDPALFVSIKDILGDDWQALGPRIGGQIVLIGASASGLNDLRGTPLGDNVPGVAIHAQALEQIVSGAYLVRADWVGGLEVVALALVGIGLVAMVQAAGPLAGLIFLVTTMGAVVGFCWFMFAERGVLIDPGFLLAGTLLTYAAMVFLRFVTTDADRRKLRHAFAHYVAAPLLSEIERKRDRLQLGGEVRELTIMFADMRGFTSTSESMDPRALVTMLNRLFGALGARVTAENGTIDKFIGDAIMAFWNAPVDVDRHAERACRAALGMRSALQRLNAEGTFGDREMAVGIGLATGDALVGNMGLETRFDYSCVGEPVNLAARVETATKDIGYDIAVARATRQAAGGLAFLEAGAIVLKGVSEPVTIFVLVGDEEVATSAAFARLAACHDAVLAQLRDGKRATRQIRAATEAAGDVDPRLAQFYSLIPGRAGDFRRPVAAAPRLESIEVGT